jgi:hypothetical protein
MTDEPGDEEQEDALMRDIRALGRLPNEFKNPVGDAQVAERRLAINHRYAKNNTRLSPAHLEELLQLTRRSIQPLTEVDAPPDPRDPFADEAANRLEQDVLMAMNGFRPRTVMRRIARYKKYMTEATALQMEGVQKYKDQVLEAAAAFSGLTPYVAGDEIEGDALRTFSEEPIITGPLVCQLCDDVSFLYDDDFAKHKEFKQKHHW